MPATPFVFQQQRPQFLPIVKEPESFTLGLQHANAYVRVTKATPATVTIPALPGAEPYEGVIEQAGAGQLTFATQTGSGVLLRCRGYTSTLLSNAQYAPIGWKWDPSTREFIISGDVTVT